MFWETYLVLSCDVSSEIIMLHDFKTSWDLTQNQNEQIQSIDERASNQQPNLVPRLPSYSAPEIASNTIFSVDAL